MVFILDEFVVKLYFKQTKYNLSIERLKIASLFVVVKMPRKKTQEEFLQQAKQIHGARYGYDKAVYNCNNINIIITCYIHGDFLQRPDVHLRGNGCSKCSGKEKLNTAIFIERAQLIHGNRYDYSEVNYINCMNKVTIICRIHGRFEQQANQHLKGINCLRCANENKRLTTAQFIARAQAIHGDLFDYSLTNYVRTNIKVIITCRACNYTFNQTPREHYVVKGCYLCRYKTQEEFLAQAASIHGQEYDYSNTNYKCTREKVEIICRTHGPFLQTPDFHLRGAGCSRCLNKTENKVFDWLTQQYTSAIHQYRAEWCKRERDLPFDVALPEQRIIIEVDGDQRFRQVWNWEAPEERQQTDAYKMKQANRKGFSVIRLLEADVRLNKYDWRQRLTDEITALLKRKSPKNVYICLGDQYEPLQAKLAVMKRPNIVIVNRDRPNSP